MSAYLGIDPGVSGAIAYFRPDQDYLDVFDMPTLTLKRGKSEKREVDAVALHGRLDVFRSAPVILALIELAGCRPGQSVSAVHANGRNWGVAYGALTALRRPTQIVTPQSWKKALGCPAAKDGARALASRLMPQHAHFWQRAKDDGRAEAALIAVYAQRLSLREGRMT